MALKKRMVVWKACRNHASKEVHSHPKKPQNPKKVLTSSPPKKGTKKALSITVAPLCWRWYHYVVSEHQILVRAWPGVLGVGNP